MPIRAHNAVHFAGCHTRREQSLTNVVEVSVVSEPCWHWKSRLSITGYIKCTFYILPIFRTRKTQQHETLQHETTNSLIRYTALPAGTHAYGGNDDLQSKW